MPNFTGFWMTISFFNAFGLPAIAAAVYGWLILSGAG